MDSPRSISFLTFQDRVDSREKMQSDIMKTVKDEVFRKNAEGKAIYTKDEIIKILAKRKRFLAPKNILTFQHLQNLSQIVRHLMVLENLLKKTAAFFPKLIVKLDGTNHEDQLKWKFLSSVRRVQVDTHTRHFGISRALVRAKNCQKIKINILVSTLENL